MIREPLMKNFGISEPEIFAQKKERGSEKIKDKIIDILQENGILEFHEGIPVLDLEKFSALLVSKNSYSEKGISLEENMCSNVYQLFFEQLGEFPVISKKDFENAVQNKLPIPKAIPLFNIPVNKKDVFNIDFIKDKKYYMNYWDQYNVPGKTNIKGKWDYEIKTESGEKIGAKEMALATEIFRTHQGYRDENEKLLVFDEDKNGFIKLTAQWTKKHIGNLGEGKESFSQNPHMTLASQCKNLLASGIIRLEDFNLATTKKGSEIQRKEILLSEIDYDVRLEDVRYSIGKKAIGLSLLKGIPAENTTIAILEKGKAGIIVENDGRKEVKYVIDLLDNEEKMQRRQKIMAEKKMSDNFKVTAYMKLDRDETLSRIAPWDITQENPKRKEESAEDYAKRLRSVTNYDFIQKISRDFAAKTETGIHNITWRQQQWLAAAVYDMGFSGEMERLYSFAEKYKFNGLKTFLICEFDLQDSQKILSIGEKISPDKATAIFERVSQIIDLSEKEAESIEKIITKDAGSDMGRFVKLQLLKEAQSIIIEFSGSVERGVGENDILELIEKLNKTKIEIVLLSSLLKSLKESGQEIDFEMIKDLDLEVSGFGEDLKEEDKKEILEMTGGNWEWNEKLRPAIVAGLEKELESPESQKYYILRYQGEIISFLKFKNLDEKTLYFGSFNVAPGMQNLKLGSIMLDKAVKTEGKKKIIRAATVAEEAITSHYIEKTGFVVDGIILDYQKTGEPLLAITADAAENKKYAYRDEGKDLEGKKEKEEIIRTAESPENLENLIGTETIILRFDMKTELSLFQKTLKNLLSEKDDLLNEVPDQDKEKYKITRYFQDKDKDGDIRYLVFEKIV